MRKISVLFLVLGLLVVTGCRTADVALPEGVQTVSGYLQSVPFSLKRRGTHALYTGSGGSLIVYAESSAVSLRLLEGQDVELEGTLEKNNDPNAAPVFIVGKVLAGNAEQMRPWTIPALNLTVSLPRSWKGTIKGGSASFTASGFTVPVLTITTKKAPVGQSPQPLYGPLAMSSPAGEVLIVGLRKAVAEVDAPNSAWTVRVAPPGQGGSETIFVFALQSGLAVESQVLLYRNALKTVVFTAASGATSSRSSSPPVVRSSASTAGSVTSGQTGSSRAQGEGSVCGGVAGILCPKGFICTITDPVSESGVCSAR